MLTAMVEIAAKLILHYFIPKTPNFVLTPLLFSPSDDFLHSVRKMWIKVYASRQSNMTVCDVCTTKL